MFEVPEEEDLESGIPKKDGDDDDDDDDVSTPKQVPVAARKVKFKMSEREVRCKRIQISRALARATKLKPKIVQCQNLYTTRSGFRCKVMKKNMRYICSVSDNVSEKHFFFF